MRFDHHPRPRRNHPVRAVVYASVNRGVGDGIDPLRTVVAERFGDSRVIDRSTHEPWLVGWGPTRPLRLLDLADSDWVTRVGANAALTSGARGMARRWSVAIWNAYGDIDGLYWAAQPRPSGRSIVLYERALDAQPTLPTFNLPLAHRGLLPALAQASGQLDYELL